MGGSRAREPAHSNDNAVSSQTQTALNYFMVIGCNKMSAQFKLWDTVHLLEQFSSFDVTCWRDQAEL